MKARIYFLGNYPTMELNGETLGTYEMGTITHMKDYARGHNKIIASIPTAQLLYIEYIDCPIVTVTVEDVKNRFKDRQESPQ